MKKSFRELFDDVEEDARVRALDDVAWERVLELVNRLKFDVKPWFNPRGGQVITVVRWVTEWEVAQ